MKNKVLKLIYRIFGRKGQVIFTEPYFKEGEWIYSPRKKRMLVTSCYQNEASWTCNVKTFEN